MSFLKKCYIFALETIKILAMKKKILSLVLLFAATSLFLIQRGLQELESTEFEDTPTVTQEDVRNNDLLTEVTLQ